MEDFAGTTEAEDDDGTDDAEADPESADLEEDASEQDGERPTEVDAGSGGLNPELPVWLGLTMMLGMLLLGGSIVATRRR